MPTELTSEPGDPRRGRPPEGRSPAADRGLPTLRYADFSLTENETAIRDTFARFFSREVPLSRVREAAPLGHDAKLWSQLCETDVVTAALPDGAGGGLVAGVLASEQMGRVLAPVPLVEAMTAARLLDQLGAGGAEWGQAVTGGSRLVSVALLPLGDTEEQIVSAGAVADAVLAFDGHQLVLVERDQPPEQLENQWGQPVARWRLDGTDGTRTPLASGPLARRLFESARRDWRILTAAALVGVSQQALEIAVEYAKVRNAFGVPIGTFQAISHPMADTEMAVETARRLARKAAWHVDHQEPAMAPLDSMALLHASETATSASHLAIHVLGGIGFTLEADAHLFFRKAKGYVLCGGDPKAELLRIADVLYGPVGAGPTER